MVVHVQSMVAPTHAAVIPVFPPRVPVLLVPTAVPVRLLAIPTRAAVYLGTLEGIAATHHAPNRLV